MRFRILGPLEVRTEEDWTPIGAAKWRAILACLLLHPGQVVSTDTLIDELWGNDPPARASNLVSIYVLRLRRLIGDSEGRVLKTRSPGYQLLLGPDDLDTRRFGILMSQGQEALTAGDPEHAAHLLADSLALWRGKALADVPPSAFVDAEAERLDELYLAALELRIEADIACDRGSVAIPDLRRLLSDQPLKEKLWLLLMRALAGAGRHAEALGAYEQARSVIADQLGVDPGPEMRQLFRELLSADVRQPPEAEKPPSTGERRSRPAPAAGRRGTQLPVAAQDAGSSVAHRDAAGPPASAPPAGSQAHQHPAASAAPGAPAVPGAPGSIALGIVETSDDAAETVPPPPAVPAPMQLPADINDFTGRELHVRQLCDLLSGRRAGDNPGAVPVALVAGAGGLGKTTLAIHAAHRMRTEYPDGQLYVDLLGAGPQPLPPGDVLARFLRDLGEEGAQIPVSEEERAALYRTRLNGRRTLVLLDNAHDAAQVRPLLPGSASCAVIVTSRSRLSDLVGGGLVHLDVLDDSEALALFSRIVGTDRAAAEPDATAELLVACAGLPLAIRICAARLAARDHWTIRWLADRIRDQHRRLDEMRVGDLAVRASFEVSFASLPAALVPGGVAPADAFRLLGLWAGPSIGLGAATALIGEPEDRVADALEFLVDAHLLESSAPDCYGFHDLLRVYADERAMADEPEQSRREAVARLLAWYLHMASAADTLVAPHRERPSLDPAPPGCDPLSFIDVAGALAWCEAERENVVAATQQAADYGLHDIAWKLPVAVLGSFDRLSYRAEWISSHLIALASARQAGDRRAEGWTLNNLGMVYSQQQRMDEAISRFEEALEIRREIGDLRGQAISTINIADANLRRGRSTEALGQLDQALSLQREAGYRYGEGAVLTGLGEAHLDLGHLDEAIDYLQQGRAIFVEIKARNGEDYVLHALARAYLELGRTPEAIVAYQDALTIRRSVGSRQSQGLTMVFLGRAQLRAGDLAEARRCWAGAYAIFDELGDEEQLAEVSSELAGLGAMSA
jgi:DNA-binding SARP family transcriptional activator